MSTYRQNNGFTLIELLIVLTIVTVFITIATPYYQHMQLAQISKQTSENMMSMIRIAQSQAFSTHQNIILCPSDDSYNCINQWQKRWIIFADANNNKKRDTTEHLFRQHLIPKHQPTITFKGFGVSGRYVRFTPNGLLSGNNGTFTYCLDNDAELAYTIIINRQGRARFGEDSNNNGIIENAKGADVIC